MSTPIGTSGLSSIVGSVPPSLVMAPSSSYVTLFDDFLAGALSDKWTISKGTDSATSDASLLADGAGGALRFTTGDAGTGLAADMIQLTSSLNWKAVNGELIAETKIKLSAITTCYAFFGFTDNTALEAPVISAGSANTITTNATDAIGFMFDTRMATDVWWLVGVKNDVDDTSIVTALAPVAGTYVTLKVALTAAGKARFYINGTQVGAMSSAAITPTIALTPTFAVSKTSVAASMLVDMAYIGVSATRV